MTETSNIPTIPTSTNSTHYSYPLDQDAYQVVEDISWQIDDIEFALRILKEEVEPTYLIDDNEDAYIIPKQSYEELLYILKKLVENQKISRDFLLGAIKAYQGGE